jgi:NTP pyrophosphatase (non-canonical NTP hydrolase)
VSNDSIQQLAQALAQFAQARDWQQFHAPKNLACALTVEASELLEHFQWLTEEQSHQLDGETRQAVAFEMADVLLYLVQLSSALNIDLLDTARRKMVLNAEKYPVKQTC